MGVFSGYLLKAAWGRRQEGGPLRGDGFGKTGGRCWALRLKRGFGSDSVLHLPEGPPQSLPIPSKLMLKAPSREETRRRHSGDEIWEDGDCLFLLETFPSVCGSQRQTPDFADFLGLGGWELLPRHPVVHPAASGQNTSPWMSSAARKGSVTTTKGRTLTAERLAQTPGARVANSVSAPRNGRGPCPAVHFFFFFFKLFFPSKNPVSVGDAVQRQEAGKYLSTLIRARGEALTQPGSRNGVSLEDIDLLGVQT